MDPNCDCETIVPTMPHYYYYGVELQYPTNYSTPKFNQKMPSSSLNGFMDRRKPSRSEIVVVDELALTKSAAWAWYERGSGSDGKSFREVDVWRSKMEPRPSRYKLEALRNVQQGQRSNSTKNSLLDCYEIDRISRQLNHYIQSSHAKYGGGGGGVGVAAEMKNKDVQKRKIQKGFWFRHVPVCGSSRNDVVENRSFEYRQRPPEKGRVAVVELVSCRPRPWGIRA